MGHTNRRPSPGAERLSQIRAKHEAATAAVTLLAGTDGLSLAVPAADDAEPEKVLVFTEETSVNDREFYRTAHEDMGFILRQLGRATDRIEGLYRKYPSERPKSPPDYTTECAMLCRDDAAFRRWLMECHDLHDAGDFERIKTHVRFKLNIDSLKDLNENPAAAAIWVKFRDEFKTWAGRRR